MVTLSKPDLGPWFARRAQFAFTVGLLLVLVAILATGWGLG